MRNENNLLGSIILVKIKNQIKDQNHFELI